MALSAPRLLKLLQDAQAKIKELEAREPEVVVKETVKEVPVEVIQFREIFVDRVVEVPVAREVFVDRVVEIPGPVITLRSEPEQIEVEVIKYIDNPDHIKTIEALKEQLCQFTSQSDS